MTSRAIQQYAMAVCYTAALLGSICTGIATYALLEITFTETIHPEVAEARKHQQELARQKSAAPAPVQRTEIIHPRDTTVFVDPGVRYMMNARKNLIRMTIFMIISGLMFFVHWRIMKRGDVDGI